MRRWLLGFAVAALPALHGGVAIAHENFRVIGTLTRHETSVIDVTNADSRTTSIRVDRKTRITRDKKKIAAADLVVGESVVVDAHGDNETDLLALEIRVVPPIGARRPKGQPRGK